MCGGDPVDSVAWQGRPAFQRMRTGRSTGNQRRELPAFIQSRRRRDKSLLGLRQRGEQKGIRSFPKAETAYKTTEFEENTEISSAFRYDTKRDRVVYNPEHRNFDNYSYPQAVTHELSHRIDALDYHSEKNAKFSKAIDDAYPVAMRNSERLSEYSIDKDGDGFFSDIISALSNGEIYTYASHSPEYWAKSGAKEKEIFANIFSMGVFDQKKHIEKFKELFPDVYEAYNEIRKDV